MSQGVKIATGIVPLERSPRPIDPGVNIGHVHLKTADIDRVHHFYVEVLGFDVVWRHPTALFISSGGYHHHLGFNTWESKGGNPHLLAPGPLPRHHPLPNPRGAGRRLSKAGRGRLATRRYNDHGTHEALYLRDPNGNGLELCWDRSEDQWPRDDEGRLSFSRAS